MQLLSTMQNAFRIADLRRKILFTLAMLVVFRIGSFIPVPGIDASGLASKFGQGNIFGLLDLFAGGSLRRFTIFAMGVNPYITSSIIIQLLTIVIPSLEEMAKEGVEGRKKIQQLTRYGTVLLAIIQGYGTVAYVREFIITPGFFTTATIILTLTAGTMFLMWLGEKISERGIGNGISLIIFAGIVARLPSSALTTFQAIGAGGINPFAVVIFLILAVVVIAAVVLIQEGQRRIPVQYPKRVVGRKVYGGQSTHIPLRVNQAGVIPVIFASSILAVPATIGLFVPGLRFLDRWLGYNTFGYNFLYALFVVFFTYFYTAVTFNPMQIADNMKKYGGFIPGLRPGRPTAEYLERVLTRITLVGALFLAAIAVLPSIATGVFGYGAFAFGSTSLLIMVGVALDTMKQIEAHLLMRHYEGFMK